MCDGPMAGKIMDLPRGLSRWAAEDWGSLSSIHTAGTPSDPLAKVVKVIYEIDVVTVGANVYAVGTVEPMSLQDKSDMIEMSTLMPFEVISYPLTWHGGKKPL